MNWGFSVLESRFGEREKALSEINWEREDEKNHKLAQNWYKSEKN